MANSNNKSPEDLAMTCQVCFEDFTDRDEHVPRILPCSHTLCEKCLGQLIRGGTLLCCPECRLDNPVQEEAGVRSFPQNKYILNHFQQKQVSLQREPQCKEHEKPLLLYCNEVKCKKCICLTCLTNTHVGHKVTEIEDKNKLVLFSKISMQMEKLETSKNNLLTAKEDLEKNSEESITKAAQKKEELIKMISDRISTLMRTVVKQKSEVKANIEEDMAAIDESMFVLESIGKNVMDMNKAKDVSKSFEIVENIEHNAPRDVVERYSMRLIRPEDVEELCGKLIQMKTTSHVSEIRAAMTQSKRKPTWKGTWKFFLVICIICNSIES